jgi:hypothetical protein
MLPQGRHRERNAELRAHFKGKPEVFPHHFHVEKSLLCFVQHQKTPILPKFAGLRLNNNAQNSML